MHGAHFPVRFSYRWASAMSQISGKDYSFTTCCLGFCCCPVCTLAVAYKDLVPHYGIDDKLWPLKPCPFALASYFQILDT